MMGNSFLALGSWAMSVVRHLPRMAFALLSMGIIFWWASALWEEANKPAHLSKSNGLTFAVPHSGSTTIGRDELVQPTGAGSAVPGHVMFFTDDDANLWLKRTTAQRRLFLRLTGIEDGILSDRYRIPFSAGTHTVLSVGQQSVRVEYETENSLKISVFNPDGTANAYSVSLSGRARNNSGAALSKCLEKWNPHLPLPMKEFLNLKGRLVAEFGGATSCNFSNHALLGLTHIDPEVSFILVQPSDGNLYLTSRRNADRVPVGYETFVNGNLEKSHKGAWQIPWKVAEQNSSGTPLVEAFFAGRTRYDITTQSGPDSWIVTLTPTANAPLFDNDFCLKVTTDPAAYPDADELCPIGVSMLSQSKVPTALHRLMMPMEYFSKEGLFVLSIIAFLSFILLRSATSKLANIGHTRWTFRVDGILALVTVIAMLTPAVIYFSAPNSETYSELALLQTFVALFVPYMAVSIALLLYRPGGALLAAFWCSLIIVVAIGSLSMFTLSAEGYNTDWERYFIKHKNLVLTLLAPAFLVVSLISAESLRFKLGNELAGGRKPQHSVFFFIICSVVLGFGAWFFVGEQGGLFGLFQPVELGKFMVVVVLGAIAAQLVIQTRVFSPVWAAVRIALVLVVIAFFVLLLGAPVVRSDWSPLLIVLLSALTVSVAGATLFVIEFYKEVKRDNKALAEIPRRFIPRVNLFRKRWKAFYAVTISLAATLIFLFSATDWIVAKTLGLPSWSVEETPDEQTKTDKQIKFLQDGLGEGRRLPVTRILSYLDLKYPDDLDPLAPPSIQFVDLGYQSLRSRAAIAASACSMSSTFSIGWGGAIVAYVSETIAEAFGACAKAKPTLATLHHETLPCTPKSLKQAVLPHCIPVVESDFAASYLIFRHGRSTAILLLIAQVGMLAPLLIAFVQLQSKRSRDPVIAGANQAMGLIALGSAMLLGLQWSMAWANGFTLLPIMGQPMTWLSAATSHHLFMAIPIALAAVCAIRVAGLVNNRLLFSQPPRL